MKALTSKRHSAEVRLLQKPVVAEGYCACGCGKETKAQFIHGHNKLGAGLRKFWSLVEKTSSCWNWIGGKTKDGYGVVGFRNVSLRAHRVSWILAKGRLVEQGMEIDHLCRNRACVNPSHMEMVTTRENVLRGMGITAQNARKTHCKHGHAFTADNTSKVRNGRHCKCCTRLRTRDYYWLKKEQAQA